MTLFLFIFTLLLSAFFSGSETSYVTANRLKHLLRARENSKPEFGDFLLLDPQLFLTTTLVGNNLVMVACSSLAVLLFSHFIPESLLIIVTTTFLLLFGEIVPKSLAQQIPNRFVRVSINLMQVFYYILYPIVIIAKAFSQILLKALGEHKNSVNTFFSKKDLPILIREFSVPDTLKQQERKLISKAIRIGEKRLTEIMVPRTEIVAVDRGIDAKKLKKIFISSGYSRLPVYEEDMDHIIGFVYVFDLFDNNASVDSKLRPVVFLPETTRVIKALKTLRNERKSMAIVVDEHGGTAGLVTVEDIIEELFGSISDEFDKEKVLSRRSGKSVIIASGRAEIHEIEEKYGMSLPKGDYVTIGGLLEAILGYIPQPGEEVEVDQYKIEVLKADQTKVIEVKITRTEKK